MKIIIAITILLSSLSALASEKVINCTKNSNVEEVMQLAYETQSLKINSILLFNKNLDDGQDVQKILPLGQILWQNFAFLVAFPAGKNLIVPFSVFTHSPSSEVILNGSIRYKCL